VIIESEPNGLMMVRYKFYFNQPHPDPEDPWILAYLQENRLQPRRELQEEHEGVTYTVYHFGQCYLAQHVGNIGDLYKKGVAHSALAQRILDILETSSDEGVHQVVDHLDDQACYNRLAGLAAQLYDEARFETGDQQQLAVYIDAERVLGAFWAAQATEAEVEGG
jgi:hypothetical protein